MVNRKCKILSGGQDGQITIVQTFLRLTQHVKQGDKPLHHPLSLERVSNNHHPYLVHRQRINQSTQRGGVYLYFVSPWERPWRHACIPRKTHVIAHATCVIFTNFTTLDNLNLKHVNIELKSVLFTFLRVIMTEHDWTGRFSNYLPVGVEKT